MNHCSDMIKEMKTLQKWNQTESLPTGWTRKSKRQTRPANMDWKNWTLLPRNAGSATKWGTSKANVPLEGTKGCPIPLEGTTRTDSKGTEEIHRGSEETTDSKEEVPYSEVDMPNNTRTTPKPETGPQN